MDVSYRIQEIRRALRLNQRGVAENMGVTQQSYAEVEINAENSKLSTLRRVADALGVKLSFLLSETEINLETIKQNSK